MVKVTWEIIIYLVVSFRTRGPESWYRWYQQYWPNPIWTDKMRIIWKNKWSYYGKSEEIFSYSDKFDIWIFNKWYKHFVQYILYIVSNKFQPFCCGFLNMIYALSGQKALCRTKINFRTPDMGSHQWTFLHLWLQDGHPFAYSHISDGTLQLLLWVRNSEHV